MTKLDVDAVLAQLTLDEKVALLAGRDAWLTVPIPRLGVPAVKVSDGPAGVRGGGFLAGCDANATVCPLGMAATFDKQLLHHIGRFFCTEAKTKGVSCILGPTCNIIRLPTGGRGFENFSEDPVLSGLLAAAIVLGIQSGGVVATIKHFVVNDHELDRRYVDVITSERALREVYCKPFQMALKLAGYKAIMTSYNRLRGTHLLEHQHTLVQILRREWGFDGLVMSDWYGTNLIGAALEAGQLLEMPGPTRYRSDALMHMALLRAVSFETIDENARRVLQFVNDCSEAGVDPDKDEEYNNLPEARQFMRTSAAQAVVLLQNDGILPLSPGERVAVIGPNAKVAIDTGGGLALLQTGYKVTPYDGIAAYATAAPPWAQGCVTNMNLPDFRDMVVLEGGTLGMTMRMYDLLGELLLKRDCNTTRFWLDQFKPLLSLSFKATLTGTIVPPHSGTYEIGCCVYGTAKIYLDDELVVDNATKQHPGNNFIFGMGTREERAEVGLEKGKKYSLRVEFASAPTMKLPLKHVEVGGVYIGLQPKVDHQQLIREAVEVAKQADKVVLVMGLNKEWELEGFDRPDMDLPLKSDELIRAVAAANPRVVVVNQLGTPVLMPWHEDVAAIVQSWYGGNETGNAIADVLYGKVNPGGKLPMTFPHRYQDNPLFVTFGSDHGLIVYGEDVFVGYRYYEKIERQPLFAFGHGLSYTSFAIDGVDVSVACTDEIHSNGNGHAHKVELAKEKEAKVRAREVHVLAQVTNTGECTGSEVVQVYVGQDHPLTMRPAKEFKEFAKVELAPGELKRVSVTIPLLEATLYWHNERNKWVSEADSFTVFVGNASNNIAGTGSFETSDTVYWSGL